jgi:hypothetical protein
MASRREQPSTRNPPHKVVGNRGFIEGACGPPHLLRLWPPELEKKREEPYLEANPAKKIHRPTPNYGHLAKPWPNAGKPLTSTSIHRSNASPMSTNKTMFYILELQNKMKLLF